MTPLIEIQQASLPMSASHFVLADISQKSLATANMKTLLLSALLFSLSFYAFAPISAEFSAVTEGYKPLDLQFPLTVERIFQQLLAYSSASKHW